MILSPEHQVVELREHGIDGMLYQGNLDLALSDVDNLKWANDMPWKDQFDFVSRDSSPWHLRNGSEAGWFKEVYTRVGRRWGE